MVDTALRAELKNALIKQELPGSGWSYGLAPIQAALEPTCLALLTSRWDSSPARARGLKFLLDTQNPNGSWPAFRGDDCEGSGLTALAVIALINNGEMALQTEHGVEWLIPMMVVSDSDLIPVAHSDAKPVAVGAKQRWRSYGA